MDVFLWMFQEFKENLSLWNNPERLEVPVIICILSSTAKFGLVSRGEPNYPNVNQCIFDSNFDQVTRSIVTKLSP